MQDQTENFYRQQLKGGLNHGIFQSKGGKNIVLALFQTSPSFYMCAVQVF